MGWFYYMGKDRLGPIDDLALRRLAANGYITPETVIENEQGQSAKAGLIRGLEFSRPNPAHPGTFAQTGTASQTGTVSQTGAAPQAGMAPAGSRSVPVPPGSMLGMAGNTPGSTQGTENGYAASGIADPDIPEDETSEQAPGLLARSLDFDLARIVGELGTEVNVNLLKNFANTCKVYFWIFTLLYWLSYPLLLIGLVQQSGLSAALLGGVVVGFPLYFVGYFFLRIGLKYCIEVTKLMIRLNRFLQNEESR